MKPILVLFATSQIWASTYYVSKSTGSDANTSVQAQNKSTPWAHLPGMSSATGNLASYTPAAGDTFILMGCDTWVNADLPVNWNWSGTSSNPITVTVDKTWYNATACPSAWNRPIWDAQKALMSGINNMFVSNGTNYVLDNVEMKGLYCPSACNFGQVGYVEGAIGTLSNLYIHGWNVVTDGNCIIFRVGGPGSTVTQTIIDGSDATGANPAGATCYAFYPSFPQSLTNNVIHDLANGVVGYVGAGSAVNIGGNLIYNIKESNAGSHPNAIEIVGGGTYYIHDNVIHDNVGESLMLGNTNEIDYVWNNVIYNVLGNMPELPQIPGQTNMTFSAWNNTIVPGGGQSCFRWNTNDGGVFVSLTIQNNHCITTGIVAPTSWNGTVPTLDHNVLMTPAVAATYGYGASQTEAYSPVSASVPTVSAGLNLTASCSGALAGLCNSTTYACTYDSGSQRVNCPGTTTVPRGSGGAWNVGAYELAAVVSQVLQPPTNLSAVSH